MNAADCCHLRRQREGSQKKTMNHAEFFVQIARVVFMLKI